MPWTPDEQKRFRELETELQKLRDELTALRRLVRDDESATIKRLDETRHAIDATMNAAVVTLERTFSGKVQEIQNAFEQPFAALGSLRPMAARMEQIYQEQIKSAEERARRAGQDEAVAKLEEEARRKWAGELEVQKFGETRRAAKRTAVVVLLGVLLTFVGTLLGLAYRSHH